MSKFKGYAQATGFKTTQIPDTTKKIREEGDRTTRRMQRNFEANQANTRAVLDALNDKYRLEQQNREFVFDLESENKQQIRQQMVDNAATAAKNSQTIADRNKETFAQLASLSSTAAKISGEYATDLVKSSKAKGEELGNIIAMAGGSYAEIEYLRSVEKAHIKNDEKFNTIFNKLLANGAPNDLLEQIKNANSSTFYGLKKTMFVNAGMDYSNVLAANEAAPLFDTNGNNLGLTLGQARSMGLDYKDQIEAQELRNRSEFISEYGSASDPMVAKYLFPKMLEVERANARAFEAKRLQRMETEGALKKQQFWVDTFDSVAGDDRDRIAAGWSAVQAHQFKGVAREEWLNSLTALANNGRFGTIDEGLRFFNTLLSFPVSINGGPPKAFEDQFPNSQGLKNLRSAIIASAENTQSTNQKLKDADRDRRSIELQEWVYENSGTFDDDFVRDALLKDAQSAGLITDETKAILFNHSADAPGRRKQILELRQEERDGTLTLSDFNGIFDPLVLKEFEATRKRLADNVANLSQSNDSVRSDFRARLSNKLGMMPLSTSSKSFSLNRALDHLMRRYQQDMAKDMGGTVTREEQQRAIIDRLIKEVDSDTGKYAISGIDGALETRGGLPFFVNFDPQSETYIPSELPSVLPRQVLINSKNDKNYALTTKFISPNAASRYLNQIKQDNLTVIPPIFHQLSNATGLDAHVILQKQIELQYPDEAKGLTINPDLYQNVMSSLGDSAEAAELNSILTVPSSPNLFTAMIAGGNKVHRVRVDENGFYDVISLARASGFRAPHVMAAIWANETRWGRSLSGKNNLFNIKSQDGSGTPRNVEEVDEQGNTYMEPSMFRDYDTPAQSAEDFINFISKYPGVAEASTPREMLQALQNGGYATNPTYADDVSAVVADFVDPDAPFIQYDGPAATDPNYQSATLQHIYNTNNLGFGSTGPHTDVKQLDNKRTPDVNEQYTDFDPYDKEFGEYLLIDDDEYGKKVPIHRPGYSDGFQEHLNRRSHGGYDYLHHMNTPVYIKPPAKVVYSDRQDGTDIMIVELPSGRRFQLIHGLDAR